MTDEDPDPDGKELQNPGEGSSPSLLKYDDLGIELIIKSNEKFSGTSAEIDLSNYTKGSIVQNMYLFKRGALVTTIYNDKNLQSNGLWPITPLQSELFLKAGSLQKVGSYREDLGLLLYDFGGVNLKGARFLCALYKDIARYRRGLGLSPSDLCSRLVVANAGLEPDSSMPYGLRFTVLPGITEVYPHEILWRTFENHKFKYGLEGGLPKLSDVGNGKRSLNMPAAKKNIGPCVLVRNKDKSLEAWEGSLVYPGTSSFVNLAPSIY